MPKGWCPDCEAEGADPRHQRGTIRCSKHHARRYRTTEGGSIVTKRANARRSAIRKVFDANTNTGEAPRAGWCTECEKEGLDPRHSKRTVLCQRHYYKAWSRTGSGSRRKRTQ